MDQKRGEMLLMDQKRGEMLCVPTSTFSSHSARSPRGALLIAFLRFLTELLLIAFMTMVLPSVIVRTSIFATRPRDQRKLSMASSSQPVFIKTSTHAETNGPKNSVGIA